MYSVPFSQDHILEEADKIACEHGIDYNSKKAKELTSLGDVNPFANWITPEILRKLVEGLR